MVAIEFFKVPRLVINEDVFAVDGKSTSKSGNEKEDRLE